MTKPQIEKRIKEFIPLLRLKDWTVEVEYPSDLKAIAEAEVYNDYKTIVIRIGPAYKTWAPEYMEEVVCHELVHAHIHATKLAAMTAEQFLSDDAKKLYYARLYHEVENLTDVMTAIILALRKDK